MRIEDLRGNHTRRIKCPSCDADCPADIAQCPGCGKLLKPTAGLRKAMFLKENRVLGEEMTNVLLPSDAGDEVIWRRRTVQKYTPYETGIPELSKGLDDIAWHTATAGFVTPDYTHVWYSARFESPDPVVAADAMMDKLIEKGWSLRDRDEVPGTEPSVCMIWLRPTHSPRNERVAMIQVDHALALPVVEKARKKKKPKLGTGERFKQLSSKLAKRPGVKDPDALAAAIGRKKYGKQRFQGMAAAGKSIKMLPVDEIIHRLQNIANR